MRTPSPSLLLSYIRLDSPEPMELQAPCASSPVVARLSSYLSPPPSEQEIDYQFPLSPPYHLATFSNLMAQQQQLAPQPQHCMPMSHILPPTFSSQSPPSLASGPMVESDPFPLPFPAQHHHTTPPPHTTTPHPETLSRKRGPSQPDDSPSPAQSYDTRDTLTPAPPPPKRTRAAPSGPVSTKDWIPPDVTGLNKREARLVKNRAAAFLSRQRKREEFEAMEDRVKALEAENARLRQDGASPSQDASEHEALRTQLRELTQREEALQERIRDLQAALLDSTSRGPSPATRSPMGLEPGASASVHQSTNLEADSDDESSSVSSTFIRPGGGMKDKSHGSVAFMVLMMSLSLLSSRSTSTTRTGAAGHTGLEPSTFSAPSTSSSVPGSTPFDFSMDAFLGKQPRTSSSLSSCSQDVADDTICSKVHDVMGSSLFTESYGYESFEGLGMNYSPENDLSSSFGVSSILTSSPSSSSLLMPSLSSGSDYGFGSNNVEVSITQRDEGNVLSSGDSYAFDLHFRPTQDASDVANGMGTADALATKSLTVHLRRKDTSVLPRSVSFSSPRLEASSTQGTDLLHGSSSFSSLSLNQRSSPTPSLTSSSSASAPILLQIKESNMFPSEDENGSKGTWELTFENTS